MKLEILFCVFVGAFITSAQTNVSQYITNHIVSDSIREVNGKVYNTSTSDDWKSFECEIFFKQGDTYIVYTIVRINRRDYVVGNKVVTTRGDRSRDKLIALKSFHSKDAAVGNYFEVVAMRNGIFDWNGEPLEVWDLGQPGKMPVISVNPEFTKLEKDKAAGAAKAKALAHNQAASDRGDAYGQFRMRERYRDGDGVEKDESKAREYFSKAVAQGHSDAAKALEKMR